MATARSRTAVGDSPSPPTPGETVNDQVSCSNSNLAPAPRLPPARASRFRGRDPPALEGLEPGYFSGGLIWAEERRV